MTNSKCVEKIPTAKAEPKFEQSETKENKLVLWVEPLIRSISHI